MAEKMLRELCITKACSTFLKSSELSWLEGIMMRALWHWENSRTRCQEIALDLQSLPIPTHRWKVTSYNSILVVNRLKKILYDEPVQISIDASRLPNSIVSDWDSVFTSKFWFFWYHFQVRLRLPPMRLLQEHWIEISWLHGLNLANPFPPDILGYVHGFSYWLIYELVMYGESLSAGPLKLRAWI